MADAAGLVEVRHTLRQIVTSSVSNHATPSTGARMGCTR